MHNTWFEKKKFSLFSKYTEQFKPEKKMKFDEKIKRKEPERGEHQK